MMYPSPTPNASGCVHSLTMSQSETVGTAKRLTNVGHWDDFWHAQRQRVNRLWRNHSYYGIKGTFLKVVRATIGDVRGKNVLELGRGGMNYRLLALHKWVQANVCVVVHKAELDEIFKQIDAKISLQTVLSMEQHHPPHL